MYRLTTTLGCFLQISKNPEDPAEPSQQFRVHNNFRNAVGFRKPFYDTDTRKFARDADGYIQVDKREFQMVEFESEDLDERTAQFIREWTLFK